MKLSITNLLAGQRKALREAGHNLVGFRSILTGTMETQRDVSSELDAVEQKLSEAKKRAAFDLGAASLVAGLETQRNRLQQINPPNEAQLGKVLNQVSRAILSAYETVRSVVATPLIKQLEDEFEKLLVPFYREAIQRRRIAGMSDAMPIVSSFWRRDAILLSFQNGEAAQAAIDAALKDIDNILAGQTLIDLNLGTPDKLATAA